MTPAVHLLNTSNALVEAGAGRSANTMELLEKSGNATVSVACSFAVRFNFSWEQEAFFLC